MIRKGKVFPIEGGRGWGGTGTLVTGKRHW